MLYREIIFFSKDRTEHINTLCGKTTEFFKLKLLVRTATTHKRTMWEKLWVFGGIYSNH
jgi:hypothetical protein